MKTKTVISPEIPECVAAVVKKIATDGIPAEAQITYKGRNTLYRLLTDDGWINIKSFHHPKFINARVYGTLRKSKARRSYEYSRRLNQAGFNTPQPIGYIECSEKGCLKASYYISRHLDGVREYRDYQLQPDGEKLRLMLAQEMAKLHAANIVPLDFSGGNVLVDGDYILYHVDVNRMAFNVKSQKKKMRMFRSMTLSPDENTRLAHQYADVVNIRRRDIEQEARRALEDYLAEKRRHHMMKEWLRILHLKH